MILLSILSDISYKKSYFAIPNQSNYVFPPQNCRFQMRLSDGCVYAPGVGYYQTKSRRDGGVRIVIIHIHVNSNPQQTTNPPLFYFY